MNKISVTGRIGRDSELRFLPNGDPILSFSIADDVGYGDKKTTTWWNCSLFGKRGEALQPHTMKGQQVVVFGMAQMREWTNKDGIKQLSPDIRIDDIQLVGGKSECQPARQQQGKQADPFNDDIPF
jgi:single-strand DNA-binding protein